MDSRAALAENFRQIISGADIPAPTSLLSRVRPQDAIAIPPGFPYSMATNLAHTVFWQDLWLKRLRGERAPSITKDWRVPEESEWEACRAEFLSGLDESLDWCTRAVFDHKMRSDEVATKTLTQIAIHDAYHLGQINLIKRVLRNTKASR